jgi:hypothetical protein
MKSISVGLYGNTADKTLEEKVAQFKLFSLKMAELVMYLEKQHIDQMPIS